MATMTGMEALMEILHREGVEYVFGLPGSFEHGLLDALQDHPKIKYILGLHEGAAVAMADGYSRASGKVAVVNLHGVPGPANAMGMLLNAYGAGSPMIILPRCFRPIRLPSLVPEQLKSGLITTVWSPMDGHTSCCSNCLPEARKFV